MPFNSGSLSSILPMLALVLGLVFVAAKVFRTASIWGVQRSPSKQRQLVLREALLLDRARRLLVVGCGDRDLVLLTGGATDVVVGWLPTSVATAQDDRA